MPKGSENIDLELGDGVSLPKFLHFYNHSNFLLKNRVKLLYVLNLVLVSISPLMIILLSVADGGRHIYGRYIVLLFITLLLALVSMYLLHKGRYTFSSNVILFNMFATVWFATFLNKAVIFEQVDNVLYVYAMLLFLPLIIQRKRTAILMCFLNILIVVLFYYVNFDKVSSLGGNVYNTIIDSVITFALASFLVVFTFSLYQSTIARQNGYINQIKEVGSQLEVSERKHREFIEEFPEIFFRTNTNGDIIYLNKTGYKTLKLSKEEVKQGVNVLNSLSDYGRKRLYEIVNIALQGGKVKSSEFVMTFGASKFNLQLFISPIIEDGKLAGIEGLAINIAERKVAEIEMKRSEELLRAVIGDSPNIVVLCDMRGKIILVNRAFSLYSNVSNIQARGKLLSEYEVVAHLYNKDFFDEILQSGVIDNIEMKFQNSQEKSIYFQYICKLMHFRGQQIIYISIADISVHKQIEEDIRKREEMLTKMLEAMPNMVMLSDRNAVVEWCNDELLRVTGVKTEEVIGKSVYDVFLKKSTLNRGFIAREVVRKGYVRNVEACMVDNRGNSYDVLFSSVLVIYNNKDMFLSVIVDTTEKAKVEKELNDYRKNLEDIVQERTEALSAINEELVSINVELSSTNEEVEKKNEELEMALVKLKEAQNQLIQSEKMTSLGLLASGIAHEINNPLNYIKGGVLGIETFFADNIPEQMAEVQPLIDAVNEGVDRATKIVKGVSRYSHTSERTDEICDLHLIIDSSIILLHNQLKDNMKVQKNYSGNMMLVSGNEGKLHQVFVNIIQNSIHAIGSDGLIAIKTDVQDGDAIIEISDNGCGISKKVMKRIFDPFFTTKESGKGSGLGLSISYNIVVEHGGQLSYTSNVGMGTKATIRLPLWSGK